MELIRSLELRTAMICQFARIGDLAQTLPLIARLARRYRLQLWCDRSVEPWAEILPSVSEIHALDSSAWRRRCLTPTELFLRSLLDCENGLRAPNPDDFSPVFALNDHPVADALLAWNDFDRPGRWLTPRLILVRSYIRMIAGRRRYNRIHLADLWVSLALADAEPVPSPPFVQPTGTRFANPVWEEWKRRKSRRIWGMILGSGAKSRRLEPEDFARIWVGIPAVFRPALVLIGGPGEEPLGERFLSAVPGSSLDVLNLIGRCSPLELTAVLNDLELLIGVDTGPLHWAAALGTKVLGFYHAEAGLHDTGPYGDGHLVLAPDCAEYPCHPTRAEQCGRICRRAFQNVEGIASLLTSSARDGTITGNQPPGGLKIYRSVLQDGWNQFIPTDAAVIEDEIAEEFVAFARRIFRSAQQEPRSALSHSAAMLRQVWEAEIVALTFPRAVPAREVDRVKREALTVLRSEEIVGTMKEYPASERSLLSFKPARIGA